MDKLDPYHTRSFKHTFFITFAACVTLAAAFLAGFLVNEYRHRTFDAFPVFNEALGLLRDQAYHPLPTPRVLEYGMIRGLLQAYTSAVSDPHSSFLEPPQAELESNSLAGKFGGIGIRLGVDSEGYPVLYPFPDGPAALAGVLENDRLIGVDSLEVTPQTPGDVLQSAIRGPEGERVTIRVARPPDFSPLEFSITRKEVALPSVTWHIDSVDPRLGILEVNTIAEPTPGEIQRAAADLQSRGASAYILDLRNNGGGLLDAGVAVARLFLKDGVVMEQQFRGEAVTRYRVEEPGPLAEIPLVVLVNGGTASASEIIAGCLQAQQRALLVGEPTYGKNSIQLVYSLSDRSSLHVTAALWWIPGLDAPKPGKGLTPDVAIPAGGPPDPVIEAARKNLFP
jgi:carboxyl-terminal processing protease